MKKSKMTFERVALFALSTSKLSVCIHCMNVEFIFFRVRDEFEQAGVSFEEHINDEHNMWKYIWFQIYLELKDPLSFSAPEYSAFKQLGNKQVWARLFTYAFSLCSYRV